MVLIADRMVEGYRLTEIASELGQQPSWVSQRLQELRNELLLGSGQFFGLTDREWTVLRNSIRALGVQTPIVIGEHLPLIDGRHRCLISLELGRTEIPAVFLTGKTRLEEHEISVALNAARRQLTQAQRRALIRSELTRDPSRSDRRIAGVCGVDHKTVGETRQQMALEERTANPPPKLRPAGPREAPPALTTAPRSRVDPPIRIDSVGRRQPATRARRAPAKTGRPEAPALAVLGAARCAHGVLHSISRAGDNWTLTIA